MTNLKMPKGSEMLDDIKGSIRSHISKKNRQYNAQLNVGVLYRADIIIFSSKAISSHHDMAEKLLTWH
jgi:hypothetical protein